MEIVEIIPFYIKVLSYLFVIVYMFSVGLETSRGEIVSLLKDSKFIFNALLANLILVPAVFLILLRFIDVAPDIRTGLLLLAFSPGGLFALNFARVSKGNVHLAVALLILLSIVAIVCTPLFAQLFLGAHGSSGRTLRIIIFLVLVILLPILLGKFLSRQINPGFAEKLAKITGTLSIILFIVTTLLSSSIKKPAMKLVGTNGLIMIVFLVVFSWAIGWLLGGKEVRDKKVMAIATSLRNAGVCLPIAIHDFSSTNAIVPILAFSGISIPMNFLFSLITKFAFRHKETNLASEPITSK